MMHQRDFVVPKIMHRFKDWSAHRLDENIMAHSSRFYLFAEDGVFRIAQRVVEGLIHGKDALPAYAGTTQKVASVRVENDRNEVLRITEANGSYWHFDAVGRIEEALRQEIRAAMDNLPVSNEAGDGAVVDLNAKLSRKKWEREHRWNLSKANLDLIASDLQIRGFSDKGPRLRTVDSTAPKQLPLSYEAEYALSEISQQLFQIDLRLEKLSEKTLKGLIFEANRRAAGDTNSLWAGIASLADRKREILARHRTGKGVWYAVIEGVRQEHGSEAGEIFTIACEKCDSLKSAEAATRRLLVENAEKFSNLIGVEPHVYTDLEWSPRRFARRGVRDQEEPF
jgi:hypothetical protein